MGKQIRLRSNNAYAFQQLNGHDSEYAVLMTRQAQNIAPVIEGVAFHPTGLSNTSTQTAIVNALQHRSTLHMPLTNLLVFSTYVPTHACIGMMKTHGINSVVYYHNGQKRHIVIKRSRGITNMIPGQYPTTRGQNRFRTQGLPPNTLITNPSTCTSAVNAFAYLQNLSIEYNGLNNNSLQQAINLWNISWGVYHNARPDGPFNTGGRGGIQPILTMGGGFPQGFVDALFMLFVYAVAGRWRWTGTGSGSRIVSVLGNSNGQIFGLGVNQRHMNITFHAETNLIQTLAGPIPAGSTLYSTLEPCFQCAGMIVKAGGTRCVYGQNDPNMTNNTALSNIDSGRHTAAMFRETFNLPRIDIGTKLDQITRRATIGAQAAAIGRTFQAQPPQPRGFKNVQQAVNATNYQHIRTRVLNILNAAPTLAVFRQADVVLETLVAGVRLTYQHGTRERIFMENIATVLNY